MSGSIPGGLDNVTEALDGIASALRDVAVALKYLGNGDASTTMGAIEAHSVQVREGLSEVATALQAIAERE